MFTLIFNQLLKMLVIMIVAFICFRIGIVDQEGNQNLSNLLLMVINPCLIITVYQTGYDAELVRGLLLTFVTAIAAHAVAIAAAHFLISEKGHADYAVERFAAIYANCGFIGIPLINSVLGSEGVFYLTAYMTVFNILSWTHGLGLLEGRFTLKRLREGLLSPIVVCTALAVILFFFQIRIPGTLLDSMNYIADMNTPVAMMIAGFSVAQADFKKILSHLRLYWISAIKLVLIPLAVLLFLWLGHFGAKVSYVTLIASSCPTAATTTMMAIRYKKNYTYASEIFTFTTVLSMITIPCITFAAEFLL